MKKRIISVFLFCIMLVTLLVGCSTEKKQGTSTEGTKAKKIKLRIAHNNSPTSEAQTALLSFKKVLEEKSQGRFIVELYPGGQLGSSSDTFDATVRGDIEMSFNVPASMIMTIPELSVWESYYIFDDIDHALRVLNNETLKNWTNDLLDKQDLISLGYMGLGFRNFSNEKRPIKKAEDFNGLTMRGYNPIMIKAWESVGTSLTSISWNEVYTSLQQNLIDGQECTTTNIRDAKFYEAQKYWSLTNHIYSTWIWFTNKEFMNNLSAEDQKLIRETADETILLFNESIKDVEKEFVAKLPKLGMEVNKVPSEEREKMGKIMNSAIKDAVIEKSGQDVYDMFMKIVEDERKE